MDLNSFVIYLFAALSAISAPPPKAPPAQKPVAAPVQAGQVAKPQVSKLDTQAEQERVIDFDSQGRMTYRWRPAGQRDFYRLHGE